MGITETDRAALEHWRNSIPTIREVSAGKEEAADSILYLLDIALRAVAAYDELAKVRAVSVDARARAIIETPEGSGEWVETLMVAPGIPYCDAEAFAKACATAWGLKTKEDVCS